MVMCCGVHITVRGRDGERKKGCAERGAKKGGGVVAEVERETGSQ